MTAHHDFFVEIVTTAESIGAYIFSVSTEESGRVRVVMEWPDGEGQISVTSLFPATIIRRLPNLSRNRQGARA